MGGWTRGFQAAGYECHGVDIMDWGYPGFLYRQDVRDFVADSWRGRVDVIVASPPCEEFSIRDMPWGRLRGLPPPDVGIVNACLRIRDVVQPRVFLLENVRGAQPWIGRAPLHRGPHYLWGDVALVPDIGHSVKGMGYKERWPGGSRERSARRALVPYALAYGFATLCKAGAPG